MKRRRAFTLFEVLVAIGLIGVLAGALALFVEDLATTRSFVTRTTERARSADAIFGAVETALQTAVVDGGARGAGISGTETSLRVLSSRTDAVGASAAQLSRAAFAPLVATEVRSSGNTVMVGRSGASTLLPAPIGAIAIRYFDGEGWVDAFDSIQAGCLPMMVEVSVWFNDPDGASGNTGDSGDAGVSGDADQPAETELPDTTHAARVRPPADRVRRIAVPDSAAPAAQEDER